MNFRPRDSNWEIVVKKFVGTLHSYEEVSVECMYNNWELTTVFLCTSERCTIRCVQVTVCCPRPEDFFPSRLPKQSISPAKRSRNYRPVVAYFAPALLVDRETVGVNMQEKSGGWRCAEVGRMVVNCKTWNNKAITYFKVASQYFLGYIGNL
jgi:hypothetical protein